MATKLVPLEIGLIDEGNFEKQINEDMRKLQSVLVKYVKQHGEASLKAKAKLSVDIVLSVMSPHDMHFNIKATTKMVVPNRPASMTMAMADEGYDDEPALFVRKSGSSKATPAQGVITTADGRKVNPDTGEVEERGGGDLGGAGG
jgi:hypothetical protein